MGNHYSIADDMTFAGLRSDGAGTALELAGCRDGRYLPVVDMGRLAALQRRAIRMQCMTRSATRRVLT